MTHFPHHNSGNFKSYDLGLVACLMAKDFKLVDLERSSTGRALFVVKQEAKLMEVIKGYWSFHCDVDAQTYFNQLKRLKNQIYSTN